MRGMVDGEFGAYLVEIDGFVAVVAVLLVAMLVAYL